MDFIIRPWKNTDIDSLVKHANNSKIAKFMMNTFPHPYTRDVGEKFIEFANSEEPIHIFAIEVDGEAVGGIGIHPKTDIHEKNAEIGYWLAEPFWGNGIVSKSIKQMVNFAFRTYNIDRVYALTFGTNKSSQIVLEKNNFTLEAKLKNVVFKNNKFIDEYIYGIRREEYNNLK